MPITRSAKKALRQSVRRRARNLTRKEAYKKIITAVKKLAATGKIEDAKKLLPQLYKSLDKAAKATAIKKNKAARLKSRISRIINKSSSKT